MRHLSCEFGFWITPRVNNPLVLNSKQGLVTAFREAAQHLVAMYDPWSLRDLFHYCNYRGTLPPPHHHWTDALTPQREMAEDLFQRVRGPADLFHDRVTGERHDTTASPVDSGSDVRATSTPDYPQVISDMELAALRPELKRLERLERGLNGDCGDLSETVRKWLQAHVSRQSCRPFVIIPVVTECLLADRRQPRMYNYT